MSTIHTVTIILVNRILPMQTLHEILQGAYHGNKAALASLGLPWEHMQNYKV